LLKRDVRPRSIVTRASFDNSIAGVAATGGSTNAVLHLLSLAREAGIPLQLEDFDRGSARTPLDASLKPGGDVPAVDLHRAGRRPGSNAKKTRSRRCATGRSRPATWS